METVSQVLAALDAAVDAVTDVRVWQAAEPELGQLLLVVEVAGRRLAAAGFAAIEETGRRGIPAASSPSSAAAITRRVTDTSGWLRGLLALAPADARRRVAVADWLAGEGVPVADALRVGRIGVEQVLVIQRTMNQLDGDVDHETRLEALTVLLAHATGDDPDEALRALHPDTDATDPTDVDDAPEDTAEKPCPSAPLRGFDPVLLARTAARLRHRLDAQAGEKAAKNQDRWEEQNAFTVSLDAHGRGHLSGVLDPVATGILLAALDPLAKPRPATADGGYDPRTAAQRRADALMVIVGTVAGIAPGMPGALPSQAGARPRMMVFVPWDTLTAHLSCRTGMSAGINPATTGLGQVLAARTVEQLACIAEIVPVLLDPDGCPLDVGQSVYAFPDRIRRAIEARDHGCTFPGCTAPAPWCHTHPPGPLLAGRVHQRGERDPAVRATPPVRARQRLDRHPGRRPRRLTTTRTRTPPEPRTDQRRPRGATARPTHPRRTHRPLDRPQPPPTTTPHPSILTGGRPTDHEAADLGWES